MPRGASEFVGATGPYLAPSRRSNSYCEVGRLGSGIVDGKKIFVIGDRRDLEPLGPSPSTSDAHKRRILRLLASGSNNSRILEPIGEIAYEE